MNKTLIVMAVALAALVACPPMASATASPALAPAAPAPADCVGTVCDLINAVFCNGPVRVFCVE